MRPHTPLRAFLTLLGYGILISFYLCTAPSPLLAQTPSPLQKGIQAMKEKRIDEALSLFRQAIQEEPQSADAYLNLGIALYQTRQFKEAEESYVKSIALDPNNQETRLRLGILYEDTARLLEAKETYAKVAEAARGTRLGEIAGRRLTRLDIRIHFDRAMDLFRKERLQEAITELKEVARLDPNNAEVYFGMGEIYQGLKQGSNAFQAFQKAVELNPAHPKANLRMGQYYEAQKEWEKARESYERVLGLQKEGPEAKVAAGRLEGVKRQIRIQELLKEIYVHIDKYEKEEALKGVETLLSLDPEDAMAYYYRGYVEDSLKRDQEAIQDLTRAMELDPGLLAAPFKLGTVYRRLGDTDKAISLFKDVISRGKPEDEIVKRAQEWLATAEASQAANLALEEAKTSLKQGETEAGQNSLEEAIRLRPQYVSSYLALALLYAKNQQGEKALAVLRQGVENNPKSGQAHLNLALYLEQTGQLREAESELRKVITLGKEKAEAKKAEEHLRLVEAKQHYQEALRQMNEKDYESALQEIQKVIAIFPTDASAYLSQGIIYDRLNKTDEAIASLRKSVELNPKYVDPHLQMALIQEAKGEFKEARSEFEKALSLNPDERTAKQIQSRLADLGRTAELYEHTRTVRNLYDDKKFKEALAETDTLIALNPSNAMAYLLRGLVFVELKQPLNAIEAFKKVLEIQPKNLQARFYLGRVYMDEGRYEEAREEFEQVVKEGAGRREADFASVFLKRLRILSYSLGYGLTLDSNIVQSTAPTMAESSSLNVGVNYILARQKRWRLLASASASRVIYLVTQGVGDGLSGSLSGQYQISNQWGLSTGLSYGYGFFNWQKSSLSQSISIGAAGVGSKFPTRLNFRYSFLQARSFFSAASNADQHTASVSMTQQLTAKDAVSMAYSFVSNRNLDVTGNNFAYRSNGISMGYSREFIKDLSGSIGLNFTNYDYSNPDSTTLFQEFRMTQQYGLSAGLSTLLSERVTLSLGYAYTQSVTNIKVSSQKLRELADILASPIPTVGGDFERHTLSISYSVEF